LNVAFTCFHEVGIGLLPLRQTLEAHPGLTPALSSSVDISSCQISENILPVCYWHK